MTYAPLPTGTIPFPLDGAAVAAVLVFLLALSVAGILAAAERRPCATPSVAPLGRLAGGWVRRLAGVLRVVEALHFVHLARRLRGEGDLVAAGNELRAAVRDAREAAVLLSERDPLVVRLRSRIRSEALELRRTARRAAAALRVRANGDNLLQPA